MLKNNAGQAVGDHIERSMGVTCWLTTGPDTRSEYVILKSFRGNNGYANEPRF